MKKVLVVVSCLISNLCFSQGKDVDHNGLNIEDVCTTNCFYSIVDNSFIYEEDSVEHWHMFNAEIALKSSGHYIATADIMMSGFELGAKLNFKLLFYNEFDKLIKEVESGEFEFYAEAGHAEPFIFSGQISDYLAKKVKYEYLEVVSSELVPYYEISSDCYVACKNHKLNEALKAFKKAK